MRQVVDGCTAVHIQDLYTRQTRLSIPPMPDPLRILHVASEVAPLIKTGGLADVAGALPAALKRLGCEPRVALPGYRGAIAKAQQLGVSWHEHPLIIEAGGVDHRVHVGTTVVDGVPTHLLAANELYDRDGIYGPAASVDYDDNARRYAVFAKASLALPGLLGWQPHVIHAHDWQAGLVPALLRRGFLHDLPATRSVFTIHNIAYQGSFPAHDLRLTGLDESLFNVQELDHWGRLNWLKAGIVFADRVTTVSPRYAEEIQLPEFAYGMERVIANHSCKLSGVLNGIDAEAWNPAKDPHLPARYSARDRSGKAECRRKLLEECHLVDDPRPCLMGVVSRLVEQKGLDLILDAVEPYILDGRLQLVILGSGDLHIEQRVHGLHARHPGRVFAWYGYNEALAHRVIAGCDALLVPSRFEPCGLTQMYAMRYGTLPIVRFTGGLADTVRDVATGDGWGFTFGPVDIGHFSSVIDRACGLYEHFPSEWAAAQQRGMERDLSWDRAASGYIDLYRRITSVA